MIQLPCKKLNNVRFDIDNWWDSFTNFFTSTVPTFFTETIPTAFSYDAYIQAVPTGKPRNKLNQELPGVCWEEKQLSSKQQIAPVDYFYIGATYTNQVTLTKENKVYYDAKIQRYYAYICNKLL